MSMTLPDAIFQLKWFAVEKIEMSPVSIHPCLYVTVTNDCLGPFRASLGMVPGKSPYYDPHGPGMSTLYFVYIMRLIFASKCMQQVVLYS